MGRRAGKGRVTRRPARPRRVPVEYLVLVGGPSISFDGFYFYDPKTDKDVPQPHPQNLRGVPEYINGSPGKPKPGTHDLYWANFVDPAVRLFNEGHATPSPGDMVTVMVYLPAYIKRVDRDWEASPYNLERHLESPWVRGKKPYDPRMRLTEQGTTLPPQPKTPISNKKSAPKPRPNPKTHPERVLDHDILMRTTSPNEIGRGIIKRPQRADHYLDLIHDIPRKIVHGPMLGGSNPLLPKVLVKLLLLRTADELFAYITKGEWSGELWRHVLDTHDEDDMDNPPIEECSFDFHATAPPPGMDAEWQRLPKVNRSKVKIKRFDYFGHADDQGVFLQYGLTNGKGKVPEVELAVDNPDWETKLQKALFTRDSFAQLWGCFQGGGTAGVFKKFVKDVIACDDTVMYDQILHSITNMPEPIAGSSWRPF